jgi:hypothetical protein
MGWMTPAWRIMRNLSPHLLRVFFYLLLHLSEDGGVYVLGDLDELERRVAALTEMPGPPRRRGTFRDDDPDGPVTSS